MNFADRPELINAIEKIASSDGSEDELDNFLLRLREWSPLPNVMNLIFHHDPELAPEEIADRILSYKPLALPGS